MKLIKAVYQPCGCRAKLKQFASTSRQEFYIGTQVECDCGKVWELAEDQRDGRYWREMSS